jgi:hypothetical protein
MRSMHRTATTKQVAAALGVKATTVQLYSRQHRIPFGLTPGGHRRYDVDEVLGVLRATTDPSALTPMTEPGLGAGEVFDRSTMATMDTERRSIAGETFAGSKQAPAPERSAALDLIGHSRRVLVAI